MISKIYSAVPAGFTGHLIEVEGDSNRGLPAFNIVGMGSKSITESRDRVRSSLMNSSFTFPDRKVTVNLAPADLHKDGTYLDLPIALSVLTLSNQLLPSDTKDKLFVGELSLDGHLRPVPGIINIAEIAKQHGFKELYLPADNLAQASLISGIELIGVHNLMELFLHLKDQKLIEPKDNADSTAVGEPSTGRRLSGSIASSATASSPTVVKNTKTGVNHAQPALLDQILGQAAAKRALEIAIAGRHNILLSGPPGAGKTMLARTATNLLPPLTTSEKIAITKLYTLTNPTDDTITERPFRTPHHTSTLPALIGSNNQPGEISLAHRGVLFLDELPEYPRHILEALRQPLEDKEVTISRAKDKTTFPADFMLIATMNPCPCGYYGDPTHECTCTVAQIEKYQKKLSGPLLDRIDIYLPVQKVDNDSLLRPAKTQATEHAHAEFRIKKALARQKARFGSPDFYNSSLSSAQVAAILTLTPAAKQLLKTASDKLSLSARSYFKVIKVARTIADLDGDDTIAENHISEALTYRHKVNNLV